MSHTTQAFPVVKYLPSKHAEQFVDNPPVHCLQVPSQAVQILLLFGTSIAIYWVSKQFISQVLLLVLVYGCGQITQFVAEVTHVRQLELHTVQVVPFKNQPSKQLFFFLEDYYLK